MVMCITTMQEKQEKGRPGGGWEEDKSGMIWGDEAGQAGPQNVISQCYVGISDTSECRWLCRSAKPA